MRDIFAEYLAGTSDLMPFFAGGPRAVFDKVPPVMPWEPTLVEALRTYQIEIGGTARFNGDEAVIITGQQPGIFTGPLYAIYKAATAIRLANLLQKIHNAPCVPVFWVASDDHDFEEVRTAQFLTKTHETFGLTYAPKGYVAGMPMARVPIESSLHDFVDRAAAITPGSELRDEIVAILHESLDNAKSIADWMARCMARLFRDTPLILFTPDLPAARLLAAPIVRHEIDSPLATTRLIGAAGSHLSQLGFTPQLVREPDDCSFFLEIDQQRCKVTYSEKKFHATRVDKTFSTQDIISLLENSPERFSANVALRCVLQQRLFPAAAYVGGPGEIAYWAQLKPLFDHFDLHMPAVFPRARAVLASTKNSKIMRRLGLTFDSLDRPFDSLFAQVLDGQSAGPVFDKLSEWENALRTIEDSVEHTVIAIEPRGKIAAESFRRNVDEAFKRFKKELMSADETKLESLKIQLSRIVNTFMPSRKPQERVYTIFSFLFEHGLDLVPRIIRDIDIDSFAVNELEL